MKCEHLGLSTKKIVLFYVRSENERVDEQHTRKLQRYINGCNFCLDAGRISDLSNLHKIKFSFAASLTSPRWHATQSINCALIAE